MQFIFTSTYSFLLSIYRTVLTHIHSSTILETIPYVRDPRILWPDSANAGFDGYLYFTINQLPYQADWNFGVDRREYPGLILRSRFPDGASKNLILGAGGGNRMTGQ
jgi:hypothetical protein